MTDQEPRKEIIPPYLGEEYRVVRNHMNTAATVLRDGSKASTPEALQKAIATAMTAIMDADFALKLAIRRESQDGE